MQHDNKVTRNVAEAALKIMMGEEPDNQQFTKEVEKAKTKASEKKSPEDEARVAAAGVTASVNMPESGVKVTEELKGGQKNIDMNKNNKIDAEDFKILRAKKKVSKEEVEEVDEGAVGATLGAIGGAALTGGPVGAGLGAIAGHKVGEGLKKIGRKIKAGAQAAKKQESVEIENIEQLEEGKLKDMVTKHMDDGHSFDTAMKKAQSDLDKIGQKAAAADKKQQKDNLKKTMSKSMQKEDATMSAAFKKMVASRESAMKKNPNVSTPAPGVTRHKAKLAQGAEYGASDYSKGGEEDQKRAKTPTKRKAYGARQNIVRSTRVSGKDVNESFGFTAMLESYQEKGLGYIKEINEDIELLDEKNKPTNPALWSRAKAAAKAKFDVYPSAYANGWAARWYKKRGGSWRSVKEEVEQLEEKKHKKEHECAKKVKNEEYGIGYCIPEMHTMLEDGTVTHYDVEFDDCIVENFPVEELEILVSEMHKHSMNEEKNKQLEEGTPTKKQVKQGIGIARDKRYAKGDMSGAVKAMDKVNKGLAQHPAVAKELKKQNESFNFKDLRHQLDELSAKKLGQYQKKALDNVDDRRIDQVISAQQNDSNPNEDEEERKLQQRQRGIKRAADKLVKKATNEEVEQINELKSKTLKSYISKAGKDLSKRVADYHSKDIASSPSKIIKRDLAIDKAKGRLSMNRQLGRAEESVQINEFEMKTTPKGIKRHYELGKKQAAAGKEMGEVSDNYGPYGIHFERGYRDHKDAMDKKKTMKEDVKDMKKVAKELANASKMHKKQSERVQKHVDQMKEGHMTDAQMDKREKIVMAMKPKMQGFKDRYGKDAKSVMYATATKQAMKD